MPWARQPVVRRQEIVDLVRHLDPRRHEHDEVVTHVLEVGHQVRGEEHAHAVLRDHLHQALEELATGQRVEAGHRFVEDEELGPLGHRQGERELCARPPERVPARCPGSSSNSSMRRRANESSQPGFMWAPMARWSSTQPGVGRGVLGHEANPGQLRPGRGGVLPQHLDAARTRREQPDRQVQQGGLAGAVGTDQSDHMAGRDVEIALIERPAPAVALAQALRVQDGRRGHAMSS